MKINVNEQVRVKLNDRALQRLKDKHDYVRDFILARGGKFEEWGM